MALTIEMQRNIDAVISEITNRPDGLAVMVWMAMLLPAGGRTRRPAEALQADMAIDANTHIHSPA
jgi:hypothetical protein